jgi:hypothetical protein
LLDGQAITIKIKKWANILIDRTVAIIVSTITGL